MLLCCITLSSSRVNQRSAQEVAVSEGGGDAAHAGTVGERRRAQERGVATNTVRSTLLGWPDRARARCSELRRQRAPGKSYEGRDDDRGEVWHCLASREAITRATEAQARRRARRPYASTPGRMQSPREL